MRGRRRRPSETRTSETKKRRRLGRRFYSYYHFWKINFCRRPDRSQAAGRAVRLGVSAVSRQTAPSFQQSPFHGTFSTFVTNSAFSGSDTASTLWLMMLNRRGVRPIRPSVRKHPKARDVSPRSLRSGSRSSVPFSAIATDRGGRFNVDLDDGRAIKQLDHQLRQFLALFWRDKGADGHATHFHAHQIAQMRAGNPQPRQAGCDLFGDKGVFQKGFDPTRIDIRAPRHRHALCACWTNRSRRMQGSFLYHACRCASSAAFP